MKKLNKELDEALQMAIEKERLRLDLTRDKRAVKQLLNRAAVVDSVVDALKEALEPVKLRKPVNVKGYKTSGDEETAVLLLSDAQIGKKTETYNSKVFAERMELVSNKVIQIVNVMRSDHPVNHLSIFWLGDIVDGQLIYPTHDWHIDQNVVNQIYRIGLPAFHDALYRLGSNFKTIDNYCVRGNHGRTSKFADEMSNFDTIMYETLRLATREMKGISWHIENNWKLLVNVMGKQFLLTHGDSVKMYLKTPIYGLNTSGMNWQGSVEPYDYLCVGHFHTAGEWDYNNFEIILNGTFVSDDEWVQEKIGQRVPPKQRLFFVHPTQGITYHCKINL